MHLPNPLLELLSNSVVLDSILPHLPLASIFAISRTSHALRELILKDANAFRYLDLSRCRGAYVSPSIARIDCGGNSWRAERMDENLTEDEFYSGPLRGVLSRLGRMNIISSVHTLVLDGLASVTLDLVSEIVQSSKYNVRMLSVRQCVNLNQRKLQQLLCYICRPSRPEGTPRLRGLYVFTQFTRPEPIISTRITGTHPYGVLQSGGAQPGAVSVEGMRSDTLRETSPWYSPYGRVIVEGYAHKTPWEETIQFCKGIIAFDAVPCTHMHAAMKPYWHEASRDYLQEHNATTLPLATVALGPEGCAGCGCAPPGTPVWDKSDASEFPLLSPPPFSGQVQAAIRPPDRLYSSRTHQSLPRRLIVSCSWCLINRHCESCHRWWCGDCFRPKRVSSTTPVRPPSPISGNGHYFPVAFGGNHLDPPVPGEVDDMGYPISQPPYSKMKVYNHLCVECCLSQTKSR